MKKLITFLLFAMMAINISTVLAIAPVNSQSKAATHSELTNKKAEYQALVNRVYAIRDMDKTNLSAGQKSQLVNELQSIKQKLSSPDEFTGLYLSSGVIIIILVVLLILALR